MGYPTWRYHRDKPACIVRSEAEESALGDGWTDTPAAFGDPAAEPAQHETEAPSPDAEPHHHARKRGGKRA